MAMANDMSALLSKIESRLGLLMLTKHLPEELNKEAWANVIKSDTMVTFSRYFPQKVRFTINEETCYKKKEHNKTVFIIKDEYLCGRKLLGVIDIDWQDTSSNNISVSQSAGYGYYPNIGGIEETVNSYLQYQMAADTASLYNNNIYLDFEYPNKISISRAGGMNLDLSKFVVNLLVEHSNLATISPTKMETFEALAMADVANFLYMNLRYFDGLETIYVNIDLKLSELEQAASRRQDVVEKLQDSYVSASNDAIPYIMTVSG